MALAFVRHQTVTLDVDIAGPSVRGSTELHVSAPVDGTTALGFHAQGLHIFSVTVDDEDVQFSVEERQTDAAPAAGDPGSWGESPDLTQLADAARHDLRASLEAGDAPNLVVNLPASCLQSSQAAQTLRVKISYSAGGGSHTTQAGGVRNPLTAACATHGDFAFFWGYERAVRHWMPCVDHPQSRHAIELRLTCGEGSLAVAPGELVSGELLITGGAPPRRQFTFKLALPTAPEQLAFAVGPLVIMPDAVRGSHITHLCPPGRLRCLRLTTAPFSSLLGLVETTLATSLPLPGVPSYTQCFLPAQLIADTEAIICPGVCFLSETLLLDERIGQEAVETHLVCADAVARQFMGVFLAPATLADTWLASGLAGCCVTKVMRSLLGDQETDWRLWEEANAVFDADDGTLPPLCANTPRWGVRQGVSPDVRRLLNWKAAMVVRQLENRVGEDVFAKLLRGIMARAADAQRQLAHTGETDAPLNISGPSVGTAMLAGGQGQQRNGGDVTMADAALQVFASTGTRDVAAAAVAAATAPGAPAAQATRLLATDTFMSACCQVGALDRGEVAAFAARHIKCRGSATLSCATYYVKYKLEAFTNELQVALRMDGPPAALSAAQAALEASRVTGWVPSCAVRVHEITNTADFVASLGPALQALRVYKCSTRFQEGNIKKGGLIKKQDHRTADGGAVGADAKDSPVTWVRVDPAREWIAKIDMRQNEAGWISQLAKDKDVRAQGEAVDALEECARKRGSYASVNALAARLEDADTFSRVRASAARALGVSATAATSCAGVDKLIRYYKDRYYDKTLGRPAANAFPSLGEATVARGCLDGLARARGSDGATPNEALDLLLEVAHHPDDAGSTHDASGFTAAALRALATAVVPGSRALTDCLALVDRHLARDRLIPSYRNAVTVAALHALAALAAQLPLDSEQGELPHAAARRVLHRYLSVGNAPCVRRAAAAACMTLAMAVAGTGQHDTGSASISQKSAHHQVTQQSVFALLTEAVARADAEMEHDPGVAALILDDAHAILVASLAPEPASAPPAAVLALPAPPHMLAVESQGMQVDVQGVESRSLVAQPPPPTSPERASPEATQALAWLRRTVRDGRTLPWRLRLAAFHLLQVAGRRPPSLFVQVEEDEQEGTVPYAPPLEDDAMPPAIPLPPGESFPMEPAPAEEFVVVAPQVAAGLGGGLGARSGVVRARERRARSAENSDDEPSLDGGETEEDEEEEEHSGDEEDEDGDGEVELKERTLKSGRVSKPTRRPTETAAPAAAAATGAGRQIALEPFGPRPGRKPLQGKTTRQRNAMNAEKRAAELGQRRDEALLALNRMLHDAVDEAVETAPLRFDTFLEAINSDKPNSQIFFYIPDYPVLVPPEEQKSVKDVRHRATSENPEDAYQSVAEFLDDVARIAAAARLYHLPRGEGEQAQPAGQYARASIVEDADALVQAVFAAVEKQREELNRLEEATRTEVNDPLPEEPEEVEMEEEEEEDIRPKSKKKGSRKRRDYDEDDDLDEEEEEEYYDDDDEYDDEGGGRRRNKRQPAGGNRRAAKAKRVPEKKSKSAPINVPGPRFTISKAMRDAFDAAAQAARDEGRGGDAAKFDLNRVLLEALHAAAPPKAKPDMFYLFRHPVNASYPDMNDKWFYVSDYGKFVPEDQRCSLQDVEDALLSPDPEKLFTTAAAMLASVDKIRGAARLYHGDGVNFSGSIFCNTSLPILADRLYAAVEQELHSRKQVVQLLEVAVAEDRMPHDAVDLDQRYCDSNIAAAVLKAARAAFEAGVAAARQDGRASDIARFDLNRLLLSVLNKAAPAGKKDEYPLLRNPVNTSRPELHRVWFYVDDYDAFVDPENRCCLSDMQDRLLSGNPEALYASAQDFLDDVSKIVDAAAAYNDSYPPGKHSLPDIARAAVQLYVDIKHGVTALGPQIQTLEAAIAAGNDAAVAAVPLDGGVQGDPSAPHALPGVQKFSFKMSKAEPGAADAAPVMEQAAVGGEGAGASLQQLPKLKFAFGGGGAMQAPPPAAVDDAAEQERKRLKKEAKRRRKEEERPREAQAAAAGVPALSEHAVGDPSEGGGRTGVTGEAPFSYGGAPALDYGVEPMVVDDQGDGQQAGAGEHGLAWDNAQPPMPPAGGYDDDIVM